MTRPTGEDAMSNETEWVLVPREPTPEMANWFRADEGSATFFTHTTIQCADFGSRYSAMLAAAPQPPAEAQPCGCGEATCTVPWEPGCGLGKSEQHAEAQPASDGGFTAADMMDARQEGRKEAQQPAAVGVPVDVVREYLDARACYEEATRRPNSHAPAPVLKHGDPVVLRLREARVALDNAIAFAQQPAADEPVDDEAEAWALFEKEAAIDADLDAQQGGRSDDR